LVIAAAVLPVVVGVLAIYGAPPIMESSERDRDVARVAAWTIMRDLTSTTKMLELGTQLFDFSKLSEKETTGVLRMLYKQDEDVDIVVLLDDNDQAVVDPVFLNAEQVKQGIDTNSRLPIDPVDMGIFLKNLPLEIVREENRAFSGVYINQRKNVALIAGALTVPMGEGKRPWILAFERSLRRIHRTVSSGVGALGHTIFVVDGGGRLVAHPDGHRFLARESVEKHPLVEKFLQNTQTGALQWEDVELGSLSGAFLSLDFLDWGVMVQRQLLSLRSLGWQVPGWAWVIWAMLAILIISSLFLLERRVKSMIFEIGELRDNAERRAEELKRIQASVLESGTLNALGDLGAGVAHEFNNPLGGILGLTQLLLRKKKEDDPDVRFLQRVEQEAKRCKDITDNLLRFSEQQAMEHREPLRIERVLDLALNLLSQKLESQGIHIEKKYASDLPRIWGNESQLQRIFLNVLLNAETAMPDGGKLLLLTQKEGEQVVVKVADTGRGIPPENIDRVFEPFFTTKHNWKGAGLGLSVVYQIIHDHQGEVNIQSELDKGTVVTIVFPPIDKVRKD
jgi:signal transduction histidine kinase